MSKFEAYGLRLMEEKDLRKVLKWRNSERIRSNMFTSHIITMGEHRNWFQNLTKQKKDIYMIFERENSPLGVVHFTQMDNVNYSCSWGFYLGEENLPRGTGLVMGYLGVNYAFHELKINKLCGKVLSYNKPSLNFHKKLGFIEEGRFQKHVLKNGKYHDVIFFGIFKDKWDVKKTEIEQLIIHRG